MTSTTQLETYNPRNIFILDGAGAILSAFFLGIVLVKYQHLVGIPVSTLKLLAIIPLGFLLVDIVGWIGFDKIGKHVLKLIMLLNVLYCVFSISAAYSHQSVVTVLGWTYIIVEVLVVGLVVFLESRVLTSMTLTD